MDTHPQPIATIAVPEYSLDLGIPIVKFVTQLRLAENEEEARQLISDSKFFVNDTCVNTHNTIFHTKDVAGTIVRIGEKKIKIIIWVDGD